MNIEPELAALLSQPWSEGACRGYVIMAMQDCGFTHKDISRVVNQLYGVFDLYTLNEAEQKYYNGDY